MKIRQKDLKLKPVFIVEVKYILKLDFFFLRKCFISTKPKNIKAVEGNEVSWSC